MVTPESDTLLAGCRRRLCQVTVLIAFASPASKEAPCRQGAVLEVVRAQSVFMIAGIARAEQYRAVESTLDTSVRSFRPLTQNEQPTEGERLKIVVTG